MTVIANFTYFSAVQSVGQPQTSSGTRCAANIIANLVVLLCLAYGMCPQAAMAQSLRGGEVRIPVYASGEERTAQSDLWVMDIYFKPMRLMPIELTDPKTGEKKREYVWYICYRAFNRELARPSAASPSNNEYDAQVINPPLFVPEFTLVTDDDDTPRKDEVLPEAVAVINRREKGEYLSTVDVVGSLPPATAENAADAKGIWGVATWRGLDPATDGYTVYLSGFSNGVKTIGTVEATAEENVTDNAVSTAEGVPVGNAVQNKTIQMKFKRPGDEFDQLEPEILMDGEPVWIYR